VQGRGKSLDQTLLGVGERADEDDPALEHLLPGRHRADLAFKKQVHQDGLDDVVLVVAQRHLAAPQLLGRLEERLAPVPGTPETGDFFAALSAEDIVLFDDELEPLLRRAPAQEVHGDSVVAEVHIHRHELIADRHEGAAALQDLQEDKAVLAA